MPQIDMNNDMYNKAMAFADEVFDVSLIKTKIVSFSNDKCSLMFLAVPNILRSVLCVWHFLN
jgi:hypothetical protein